VREISSAAGGKQKTRGSFLFSIGKSSPLKQKKVSIAVSQGSYTAEQAIFSVVQQNSRVEALQWSRDRGWSLKWGSTGSY